MQEKANVSFIEIAAKDAGKTRAFLEQLFGWTFHPMGTGSEGWFETPLIKAGLHGGDPKPRIDVFFSVPDLSAAIMRVRELGGEVDEPSPEEPGFGRFCNCRDPQGISFGLHQR